MFVVEMTHTHTAFVCNRDAPFVYTVLHKRGYEWCVNLQHSHSCYCCSEYCWIPPASDLWDVCEKTNLKHSLSVIALSFLRRFGVRCRDKGVSLYQNCQKGLRNILVKFRRELKLRGQETTFSITKRGDLSSAAMSQEVWGLFPQQWAIRKICFVLRCIPRVPLAQIWNF